MASVTSPTDEQNRSCTLCTTGSTAVAFALDFDYIAEPTPVCATHANALENGVWDGVSYDVVDIDEHE